MEGFIEPIQFSDWAAPIVPIVKKDGRIRICGDYQVTIKHLSKLDFYPIPKADDLFAALAGSKSFQSHYVHTSSYYVRSRDTDKHHANGLECMEILGKDTTQMSFFDYTC